MAEIQEIQKSQYAGAIALIAHEDTLNWSKLRNLLYATLGLLAAYGLVARELGDSPYLFLVILLLVISAVGTCFALGFLVTLFTGVRCLQGHKQVVVLLEEKYVPDHARVCTFSEWNPELGRFVAKKGGHRLLLKCAPLVCTQLWVLLAALPLLFISFDVSFEAPWGSAVPIGFSLSMAALFLATSGLSYGAYRWCTNKLCPDPPSAGSGTLS